ENTRAKRGAGPLRVSRARHDPAVARRSTKRVPRISCLGGSQYRDPLLPLLLATLPFAGKLYALERLRRPSRPSSLLLSARLSISRAETDCGCIKAEQSA